MHFDVIFFVKGSFDMHTFDIRRTSIISGRSFKLFVISTIMTHRETVIRIEPPRKDAAPNKAYLEIKKMTHKFQGKYGVLYSSLQLQEIIKQRQWQLFNLIV